MQLEIETVCQNCTNNIVENFCSHCGQKKYKRIDKKYIWDEIQYTFLHFNKGFLYSIKNIILNPGKTARTFIDGNRVNHYKPISLAFVLAGISAFLSLKLVNLGEIMQKAATVKSAMNNDFMQKFMSFNEHYSSFIMLALVPIMAVFTKLVFRKWGQNYYEHVVMNAFGLCIYLIFSIIVVDPIAYFVKDDVNFVMRLVYYTMAFIPIFMVWFYHGFYPERKLKTIIWKVFLIVLLIFVTYILLIIGIISFILFTKGPEALKAFQTK